ncbi:hypothetical protein D7V82_13895 [bacterium 1xD8-6]|nr:hypothetical protein D7V72_15395 [bacterium D16-36]RKI67010.1 hypothetical protein D7V82_13895 [bacterium 1xD8-6]
MKNRLGKNKKVGSISIIEGHDGPTSFFIAGRKNLKQTLKQNIQKFFYDAREQRIVKSLKANPHSMEQVADYIVTELGFSEVDRTETEYKTEYFQMRASFILQYKPELLGDLAEAPKLENHEEEAIKLFMEQIEQRQKAAENIPPDIFDIDLHIYEKDSGNNNQSKLIIEKNYGYIGGSASGSKNGFMKEFDKTFRKVYLYYGVTQKDIDNSTKRYIELVKTLARR